MRAGTYAWSCAAAQLQQYDALKNDKELKREIGFEEKIRALMAEYDLTLRGVVSLLDPQSRQATPVATTPRRERQMKVYKNPQTGEVVKTKGGQPQGA